MKLNNFYQLMAELEATCNKYNMHITHFIAGDAIDLTIEEAEDIKINQEENCRIVREILHDIANIKETDDKTPIKTCINCVHKDICYKYRLNYVNARDGFCSDYKEDSND